MRDILNEFQNDERTITVTEEYLRKAGRIHVQLITYLDERRENTITETPTLPNTAVKKLPKGWKWVDKKEGTYNFARIVLTVSAKNRKNVFVAVMEQCEANTSFISTSLSREKAKVKDDVFYSAIKAINDRLAAAGIGHSFESLHTGFYYLNKKT